MVILTLNCGSSSVKYQVYDWNQKTVLARGMVERVGTQESNLEHSPHHGKEHQIVRPTHNHKDAIQMILDAIVDPQHGVLETISEIMAVGHRVLHGGQEFAQSVLITPAILDTFRSLQDLGPLHLPPNIMGIEAVQEVLPGVPNAAILDTAWHQTMPESSYVYPVPYEWYLDYGVRKYGFHGTSFLSPGKPTSSLPT